MKRISGHFPTGSNPNTVLINSTFQLKQIFQVASASWRKSFLMGGNWRKRMKPQCMSLCCLCWQTFCRRSCWQR